MTIALIALLLIGIDTHDIQVAYYKMYEQEGDLKIDFVFEQDDVSTAFNDLNQPISHEHLVSYVQEHFSIVINKKPQLLSFSAMQNKDKHLYLTASIPTLPKDVQIITIENTCLLSIEGHSNIIETKLYGKDRDFLMNKDRTTLKIEY